MNRRLEMGAALNPRAGRLVTWLVSSVALTKQINWRKGSGEIVGGLASELCPTDQSPLPLSLWTQVRTVSSSPALTPRLLTSLAPSSAFRFSHMQHHLGIDIAKLKFDSALLSTERTIKGSFPNTPPGFEQLLQWLRQNQVDPADLLEQNRQQPVAQSPLLPRDHRAEMEPADPGNGPTPPGPWEKQNVRGRRGHEKTLPPDPRRAQTPATLQPTLAKTTHDYLNKNTCFQDRIC